MPFYVVALILLAGTALMSVLSRGPQKLQPAAFAEITLPQTADGTPMQVIFGDVWIDDWTVLWYGNYQVDAIYASSKGK